MKVLIAEDDPVTRFVIQAVLESWGHEVTPAANGREAWDALQWDGALRLAVLDRLMPEIDGLEFCHKAREAFAPERLYIIIQTATGAEEELDAALSAGADDCITKPFEPRELQARIQTAAKLIALQDEASALSAELAEARREIGRLKHLLDNPSSENSGSER